VKIFLNLFIFNKKVQNKLIELLREPLYLINRIFLPTVYKPIIPGSIAIWDLRTMHCGNTMIKGDGKVLSRFLIKLLPNWLIKKIIMPFPDKRISMFITFAINENINIEEYVDYFYPEGVFGKNLSITKI